MPKSTQTVFCAGARTDRRTSAADAAVPAATSAAHRGNRKNKSELLTTAAG